MENTRQILRPALRGALLAGGLFLWAANVPATDSLPPPSNAAELESEEATIQAFEAAAAEADAAVRQARTVDAEWPQTEATLKQALLAAQAEDYPTAMALFETLRQESERSYRETLARREAAAKEEAARKAALEEQAKAKAK